MKRFLLGVVATVALTLGLGVLSASAATNNFRITNYDVNYQLGRDSEGRSTLKTIETITANFPQSNQNHGLERMLPLRYDDHSTGLKIASIVDGQGRSLKYSSTDSGDNRVVRVGDADTYVHGLQTYVVTYTQRDVTRFYADTNSDEFYWDINGTQWSVPIDRLSATIVIDDSFASVMGSTACYQGSYGATNTCPLVRDGSTLSTSANGLAPGEGLTVALGFTKGTFAAYQMSTMERVMAVVMTVWVIGMIVLSPIAVALLIWALVRWYRVHGRRREVGTIIPEYLPPKNYSVTVASHIESVPGKVFTAQLIDFAVRHYIKIYQTKEASGFTQAQYELELVKSIDDLRPEEQTLLKILFPSSAVGSRFVMKTLQTSSSLGVSIQAALRQFDPTGNLLGLRHKDAVQSRWFKRLGGWMLVVGALSLSPVMLPLGLIVFFMAFGLRPLTDEGLSLRRYLLGLKQYISVAEVDRLRMLQSPEGASKVGVAINDGNQAQLVTLYERVLPYAILFNQEKDWSKQLGAQYESTSQQPDWYQGSAVFNAAVFGAAMGSFSTSTASSYASSTSSSSGGSSGGGSSGGGGGGGGGGGW